MDQKRAGIHLLPELPGGILDRSLQTALNAGGVGLWEWHPESRNLAVSAHLESLLGYPSRTFDGTAESFLSHLLPVDRQRVEHAVSAAAERGQEVDLEFRVMDLTGLGRWFWAKGRVLQDVAGETARVVGTMQEIPATVVTERRMRRQQSALLELLATRRITQLSQDEAFRAITELAGQQLETERTSIWLLEENGGVMRCVSLYRRSLAQHTAGATLTIEAYPDYFRALDTGRALAASDAQHDPSTAALTKDYLAPLGITAMLEATVRRDGKLIGVVCHEHVGPLRNWLLDEKGFAASIADVVAIVLEAEHRQRLAHALEESEERYRNFVNLSTEAILRSAFAEPLDPAWPVDQQVAHLCRHARVAECNIPFAQLVDAASPDELTGRPLESLLRADAFTRIVTRWIQANYRLSEHETEVVLPDGSSRWLLGSMVGLLRDGRIAGLWTSFRDVTQRKESIAALEYQANHDSLTGLPNRKWLGERLAALLNEAARTDVAIVLMMMDLDHFKEINDTLGHFAGDQLLKLIGPRLAPVLEAHEGELARLGGDEFAVVVQHARDGATVEAIATGLITALREPFAVGSLRLGIDASIGAAVYPTHGQDASGLMRCADIAMYEAKRKHLSVAVYSAADDRHTPRRLTLAHALGDAIRSGQIVVHYQPILDLKEHRVRGVEALARWQHPEHGLVAPGEFIPVAETGDQIRQLTLSVLAEAVAQWDAWRKAGFLPAMAVNLSTRVLVDRGFADEARRILTRFDMPGEYLQFEITESAMLSDAERAIATVRDLNALGVTFSIDDFGIGFSSLSYLKQLPIHSLKIDKSFVSGMASSDCDASIVRSIIDLAHNLGLRVVAEGVETEQTLALAATMGCDDVQGYLLALPQPGMELLARVTRGEWG
jgi:diguanylate cyclase (GGDEF)-like protein